jgi:NADPH-dependent curcumin reductase CurA
MEVHANELQVGKIYDVMDRFDDQASPRKGEFVLLYKDADDEESERAIFLMENTYLSFDPVMKKFMEVQAGGKRSKSKKSKKSKGKGTRRS